MKKCIISLLAAAGAGYWLLNRKTPKLPEGIRPLENFSAGKYLGKWYEIARMSEKFERGLTDTTAEYTLNKDGSIRVENRGYDAKKDRWEYARAVAKFVKDPETAQLKVSFFRPFWAGYNVVAIEGDYQYALVCGDHLKHLWILSRTKEIPGEIREKFLQTAENLGFDTSRLIWVKH